MKSYIVIGLGLFGAELARKLCTLGCENTCSINHADFPTMGKRFVIVKKQNAC